jgi:hypothetical protein
LFDANLMVETNTKSKPTVIIKDASNFKIDVKENEDIDQKLEFGEEDLEPRSKHLKGFLGFLFYLIIITCIWISPAVYFIISNGSNIPNLSIGTLDELVKSKQLELVPQSVRW